MIESKPKVKSATVDSCFKLIGIHQHGVAATSRMFNQHDVSCLLNARGDDSGWSQIQTFANLIARYYEYKQRI